MNNIEVSFYGAPQQALENDIQRLLETCDKASIAVAYIKGSGVNIISKCISNKSSNLTPEISIITGFDFSITDPDALLELIDMGVECYALIDNNFHPKLYIFENGDDATLIVGSSNLSKGGLISNHEVNVIIKGKASEGPIKDALRYFSFLKSESFPLDEHAIELYRKSRSNSEEVILKIRDDIEAKKGKDELHEYLNQMNEEDELSEHDELLLKKAEEIIQESQLLFEEGNVDESILLLQTAYTHLNNLNETNSSHALYKKFDYNMYLSRAFAIVYKKEESQAYANKAELMGKEIYERVGDIYYYLLGLSYSAEGKISDINKENKCDEFIKFHISHKDEIDKISSTYSQIGRIYAHSSLLKLKHGDINLSLKYITKAVVYLEKDLKNLEESNSIMSSHLNYANSLDLLNEIEGTHGQNEIDMQKIRHHYDEALNIAKNELETEFWEAIIRLQMSDCFVITRNEKSSHLKIAENIFNRLNYPELVEQVSILREKYDIA
jgi:HKD family nuclease